ncbi:unnamed protein product [Camellia sinensis]
MLSFASIADATNNSNENKLGAGGFGPIYKDPTKRKLLDWKKRLNIIEGIFKEDETEAITNKVVGTYGMRTMEKRDCIGVEGSNTS